jgi:hypothetical protein
MRRGDAASAEDVLAKFPYTKVEEDEGWTKANWIEQHKFKTGNRALRFRKRLKHYRITEEQFDFLFYTMQRGCCAICKIPIGKFTCRIDHDHFTGQVRGLLCDKCNTTLGFIEKAGNALEMLTRMRSYIEAHLLE